MDPHAGESVNRAISEGPCPVVLESVKAAGTKKLWLALSMSLLLLGTVPAVIFAFLRSGGPPEGSKPAIARVVRASPGSCFRTTGENLCFRLNLEVRQDNGPDFSTEINEAVEPAWSSRVQPGSWIRVLIDPRAPTKVYLDAPSFEVPAPVPSLRRAP
jgi:hypothetical protein